MVCSTTRQTRTKSNLCRCRDSVLFNDQIAIRLSLRIVTGFVQSLIKLCGLDWTAPDYSTLCKRQKHIDIAIRYQKSRDGLPYAVHCSS